MSKERALAVDERYSSTARVLHWTMALGFLFMWACGYAMTALAPKHSPLQEFLFGLHISIGVTLLSLFLLRVAMRLAVAPPPLPAGIRKIDRIGSRLGHFGLYVLPALIIAAGWATTDLGGHGVAWFGFALPKLLPMMETWAGIDIEHLTSEIHELLAYGMLALVGVHIAAVVKHRWIDGHDVLYRMTGRRQGRRRPAAQAISK